MIVAFIREGCTKALPSRPVVTSNVDGEILRSDKEQRVTYRRRLILTDAIVMSCLSAVAVYPKRSRLVSNGLQFTPGQLPLFYPTPEVDQMILSLMVMRLGSKQRDLDDVQELRTLFVLVTVLQK